jgi:hypothetical protein
MPSQQPAPEMRAPPSIDELLRDIKQTVAPAPKKVNKPGSTGKNSVVIKL